MDMKKLSFCALSAVCLVSLGADKPRVTSDKKPLPDAVEQRITTKLALIGTRLGGLPEEVSPQLWELNSDLEVVKAARRQFNDAGLDLKDYDYLAGGVAGSTRALVDIEDGRVRRLMLIYPGMTAEVAQDRMRKLAGDASERPEQIGNLGCRFVVEGSYYFARGAGRWEKTKGAERGVFSSSSAKTTGGPIALEVGVDRMDWYVTHTCKDEATLTAVREGRLVSGMRMVEAYLAMRSYELLREKVGDTEEKWTWTKDRVEVKEIDVFVTDYGSMARGRVSKTKETIMTAEFRDGVLVSVGNPNAMR